jgi:hypothetical protein
MKRMGKMWSSFCELRAGSDKLRAASDKLRAASYKLQEGQISGGNFYKKGGWGTGAYNL